MRERQVIEEASELDTFDNVTEEEILSLWNSLKSSGLSEDEAWDAIVAGVVLEMAFDRSESLRQVDQ